MRDRCLWAVGEGEGEESDVCFVGLIVKVPGWGGCTEQVFEKLPCRSSD
jgi:hypothetical protein